MLTPQVEFRPVTDRAVMHVARFMREADRREVDASHGMAPHEAVASSVEGARLCAAAWVQGRPAAILGLTVIAPLTGLGSPWMLGTEGVFEFRRSWTSSVAPIIAQMLDICPRLVNYVHAENHVSLRWLQKIGFKIDPLPIKINGHDFYKFTMERHNV